MTQDTKSLVERLRAGAESERLDGPSAEHTAALLDEAADALEAISSPVEGMANPISEDLNRAYAELPGATPASVRRAMEAADAEIGRLAALLAEEKSRASILSGVIESERTFVARMITRIEHIIHSYYHLIDSRGSYQYDDDKWRDEFKVVAGELRDEINRLRAQASDWTHCPVDPDAIAAAREDWKDRAEKAEAALKPFAEIADEYSEQEDDTFDVLTDKDVLGRRLTLDIFRAARAALGGTS